LREKIVQTVTHPLFISLIISLVIIYYLPEYFTKFKVSHVESYVNNRRNTTYFKDLNNDFESEKIIYRENTRGNVSFEINDSNGGLVDQWNYDGTHASKNWQLWFFDVNKNGFKEVYTLTKKNDSIMLNIEEPYVKNGTSKKNIFIESLRETDKTFFLSAYMFANEEADSTASNEVFIMLNRGFLGDPRNLYKLDILSGRIIKSPHLTNQSRVYHSIDLDLDGNKELLFGNYGAGNSIDTTLTKRSDYSTWLMVLDNDLQFKFEPIEIKNPFSSIRSIPLKNNSGDYDLLSRIVSRRPDQVPNKLQLYSHKGQLIKEQVVAPGIFFVFPGETDADFVLFNLNDGQINLYNNSFVSKESFFIKPNSLIHPLDIKNDGKKEWIAIEADQKTITIYDENFESPVSLEVPSKGNKTLRPKLKQIAANQNQLYFVEGNNYYLYEYYKNPLYNLRYVVYLSIFLFINGIVWIIRKGQQIKMDKQRAIENQIAQLQIKNINNQIDPHFVFNAINTISEMTLMENKFEADNFITKFSNFMRGTLKHSDSIVSTLEEEIKFTENFIKLQQIRFNDSFDYGITIEDEVDLSTKVPKHVLFSYVENAIKHGLSRTKEKGMLKVNASIENSELILVIEDNGPGIQKSDTSRKDSTGNGLRIMVEMFELFYELYKKQIRHSVIELVDKDNIKNGIKVELRISI